MNYSAELKLIVNLIKVYNFKCAEEKMQNCTNEIRNLKTNSRRDKVSEINYSLYDIYNDIASIENTLKQIKGKISLDLYGFEQSLHTFKDEILRLKSEKRRISKNR